MKFEIVSNPVDIKQSMDAESYEMAKQLGKAMAEKVLSDDEIVPNKTTDLE